METETTSERNKCQDSIYKTTERNLTGDKEQATHGREGGRLPCGQATVTKISMALYLQIAGSSSLTPLTLTAQLTSLKIGKVDGWMEEEGGGCRLPWPCCCNHQRDGAELGCVLAGDTPQLAAGN